MNKRQNGAIAESKATSILYEEGLLVSVPQFREVRYDLVVDSDGELYRVQVKRGYESEKGTLRAELRSRNQHGNTKYSDDDFDALIIYNPENGECYWLWQKEITADQISIYTKDWDSLNSANKARCRNSEEYTIRNRNI
jgi:hypothetical protein